jgi:sodium-dependent phosphate cotransporter
VNWATETSVVDKNGGVSYIKSLLIPRLFKRLFLSLQITMRKTAGEIEGLSVPLSGWQIVLRNTAYILAALLIFLFALDLMISSLEHLGETVAETIILATSNPFTGLFIGLLVTAIIQSSSATTSMTVALVASGSINLEGAVPIIMGANIGTTITSTIVSLGFITRKKEFRRAVAGGTYHSFFNILTALILFPLEYYYGFLSKLSQFLATAFFHEPIGPIKSQFSFLGSGFTPVVRFLVSHINNGFLLGTLSVLLLFGSILFFRKVLTDLLGFGSQDRFRRFFFKSPIKSFVWGILTTAAIRSSTVTTSLVVPLVAKKVVKMKAAVPFILGANIGTTLTAFMAAMFNSNAAISIAISHFLFNFIGVLIFFPIPYVNKIPVNLAAGLGKLTLRYRLIGFFYLMLTFFLIPFSLIYLNKDSVVIQELTYERTDDLHQRSLYKVMAKEQQYQKTGDWAQSNEAENVNPVISIQRSGKSLLFNHELYEFNTPGSCREGKDSKGSYSMCVSEIIRRMSRNGHLHWDSVYVFKKHWLTKDSISIWYYISSAQNLLVKKEKRNGGGKILSSDQLIGHERR